MTKEMNRPSEVFAKAAQDALCGAAAGREMTTAESSMPDLPAPTEDEFRFNALFDAARDFIRNQDGCVVGIIEVLDHLDRRFGKSCDLYGDVNTVLWLCACLWDDPDIHQVAEGGVEFAWSEDSPPQPRFEGSEEVA